MNMDVVIGMASGPVISLLNLAVLKRKTHPLEAVPIAVLGKIVVGSHLDLISNVAGMTFGFVATNSAVDAYSYTKVWLQNKRRRDWYVKLSKLKR